MIEQLRVEIVGRKGNKVSEDGDLNARNGAHSASAVGYNLPARRTMSSQVKGVKQSQLRQSGGCKPMR